MSPTAGRVVSGLSRRILSSGPLMKNAPATVGARFLALSSQARSKPSEEDEVVKSEPIKFSTSKASHRTWKVDRSMGSQYERPWWKVVPISLGLTAFLLWCALREETDVDAQLEKRLYEHLPSLVSDESEDGK
ncbi:PREDICTED: protein CCSMST1 [Cyprinodon variegatus]|uniref:protein CCSMST1 n=1 Tax=Cyprinodon variegatus TaxID=28743 RepID=UPI0007424E86|nr:PREDICTED: protein CCSMST1 [Cyprinodon variegatus]